ncbi:MAG: T9SS type A sorting domain-containing protein [Crocinitomix sp.]|nr:T9SS type A sorting domain-containing protein [Crocinitomix sp.]
MIYGSNLVFQNAMSAVHLEKLKQKFMKLFYIYLLPLLLLTFSGSVFAQADADPVPIPIDPCVDSLPSTFFVTPIEGTEGCHLLFFHVFDLHYGPLGLSILNIEWDFGDGNTYTEVIANHTLPTHVYSSAGTYTVCATVWSTNGEECCKTTFCKDIVVENDCDPCDRIEDFDFELEILRDDIFEITQTGGLFSGGITVGYLLEPGDGRKIPIEFPYRITYYEDGTYALSITAFIFDPITGTCCSKTVTKRVVVETGRAAEVMDIIDNEVNEVSISSDNLTVFPNPTNGEFTIKTENELDIESVTIYDMTGAVLYSLNDIENLMEVKMDLQHLSAGMYYILVNESNEDKRAYKQLVIE